MENRYGRVVMTALVLLCAACGPALVMKTIRIESEPSGARVYDPKTDQVIGETPLEVALEYHRDGMTYVRRRSAFDQYSPQDPDSGKPHEVKLKTNDSVRVLVVKEGFEHLEQTVDWYFNDIDREVVKKRVFLKPQGTPLKAGDDVYR